MPAPALLGSNTEIGAELLAEAAGVQRTALGDALLAVAHDPDIVSDMIDALGIAAERDDFGDDFSAGIACLIEGGAVDQGGRLPEGPNALI